MLNSVTSTPSPVGVMLKEWRQRRRISQLRLSAESGISSRHLSFVETGRSKPSSELLLRLSDFLDVPLRERNRLLLAGGYAPAYPQNPLSSNELSAARAAVRQVLAAYEPFPALAVDRLWNILDTNAGVEILTRGCAPHLLEGNVNGLRLTLHPDGMAPRIVNLGQWREHLLSTLHRGAQAQGDAAMLALYEELRGYPGEDIDPHTSQTTAVHVPLILQVGDRQLSFLAVTATFGTAADVTLSELAIESFLPADPGTADYLRRIAETD